MRMVKGTSDQRRSREKVQMLGEFLKDRKRSWKAKAGWAVLDT